MKVYLLLFGLLFVLYGSIYILLKGHKKFIYTLIIGFISYIVLALTFVLIITNYGLSTRENKLISDIMLAIYISYPFVFPITIILVIISMISNRKSKPSSL